MPAPAIRRRRIAFSMSPHVLAGLLGARGACHDAIPDDGVLELAEYRSHLQHRPAVRGGRVRTLLIGVERDVC